MLLRFEIQLSVSFKTQFRGKSQNFEFGFYILYHFQPKFHSVIFLRFRIRNSSFSINFQNLTYFVIRFSDFWNFQTTFYKIGYKIFQIVTLYYIIIKISLPYRILFKENDPIFITSIFSSLNRNLYILTTLFLIINLLGRCMNENRENIRTENV